MHDVFFRSERTEMRKAVVGVCAALVLSVGACSGSSHDKSTSDTLQPLAPTPTTAPPVSVTFGDPEPYVPNQAEGTSIMGPFGEAIVVPLTVTNNGATRELLWYNAVYPEWTNGGLGFTNLGTPVDREGLGEVQQYVEPGQTLQGLVAFNVVSDPGATVVRLEAGRVGTSTVIASRDNAPLPTTEVPPPTTEPPPPPPPPPPNAPGMSPAGGSSISFGSAHPQARELYFLVNNERAAHGLGPVNWNDNLGGLAQRWSQNMAAVGSMSHQKLDAALHSPAGAGLSTLAENVFAGGCGMSAGQMHQAWMNSPGHRANILGGFSAIGIGIACNGGTVYATENFGR
jgi:uncharacterized protein YkwD